MMDRRAFLLGTGALALTAGDSLAALPIPSAGKLTFKVVRKDETIGYHEVTFSKTGDTLVVRISVDLSVKLGPVPIYRYSHRVTETWRGDTVVAVDAHTNDNGSRLRVSGERKGQGLSIVSTKSGSYDAPSNALPATHWNRRMLDGPFINTQTGALMRPAVTFKGAEQIQTASGQSLTARRFALSGPVRLDTWYDDTPTWQALVFTAEDGSQIAYRKV